MSEFDKAYDPTQGRNEGQDSNAAKRAESGGAAVGQQRMPSTSDDRVKNNVMRHEYKALNAVEKEQMQQIKDIGLMFHEKVAQLGNSREVSVAKTKIEEAVMWAVKHITA